MSEFKDWLKVRDLCREKVRYDNAQEIKKSIIEMVKGSQKRPEQSKPKGWDDCIEIDITPEVKDE